MAEAGPSELGLLKTGAEGHGPALTSPQFLQLMTPPGTQSLKTLSIATGFSETL